MALIIRLLRARQAQGIPCMSTVHVSNVVWSCWYHTLQLTKPRQSKPSRPTQSTANRRLRKESGLVRQSSAWRAIEELQEKRTTRVSRPFLYGLKEQLPTSGSLGQTAGLSAIEGSQGGSEISAKLRLPNPKHQRPRLTFA
jgi:hypothetical protein